MISEGTYRPTTLRLASKRCPLAISHYHSGVAIDRRIFTAGTSAHAIIQAVIEATSHLGKSLDTDEFEALSLTVCERMIREGRSFEGVPEPPMPADDVWRGRSHARDYLSRHPIEPSKLLSMSEAGMAVDANWQPVDYSSTARLRLIADYVAIIEEFDEESSARFLVVRDYKTAWPTNADELDTVQLRAQAVLAWIFHGQDDIEGVRQEVANLRTGVTYKRDLWMIEDGAETLERWKDEIDSTMRALDGCRDDSGVYAASPGGGCIGCPYLEKCEPGRAWTSDALEHDCPEDRAVAYVALTARAKSLAAVLKQETSEEPISIPGGKVVGIVGKEGRAVLKDAWKLILDEWTGRGGEADGLLKALGVGVTQVDKVAKALFPERADTAERKEWAGSMCGAKVTSRFGVHDDGKPPAVES